jgi:hypothetical protein
MEFFVLFMGWLYSARCDLGQSIRMSWKEQVTAYLTVLSHLVPGRADGNENETFRVEDICCTAASQ